jgi:hypothetical protein
MAVKDSDHGFKALLKRMKGTQASLTVGIHAAQGGAKHEPEDGEPEPKEALTVAEVGAFHEFGLGHNPRRSFVADWSDEREEEHRAQMEKMAKAVVQGKVESVEQGFERLGNLYVGEIQKRMADGIDPALEDATIKRKGSSVPLINSGQLRSAITYEVKKGE